MDLGQGWDPETGPLRESRRPNRDLYTHNLAVQSPTPSLLGHGGLQSLSSH